MKMALVTTASNTFYPSYYSNGESQSNKRMWPDFVYEGVEHKYQNSSDTTGVFIDKYRTQYYDARTFAKKVFKSLTPTSPYVPSSYYGLWSGMSPEGEVSGKTTVWLKIMLNLKRNDADENTQNVLYVLTYPVKLVRSGLRYAPQETLDYSGLLPAATNDEVVAFCNSSKYTANRATRIDEEQEHEDDAESVIGISNLLTLWPNPNNGTFRIAVSPKAGEIKQVIISDMAGREQVVSTSNLEFFGKNAPIELQIEEKLTKGTYIVTVITNKQVLRSRFVLK
jgi:hypothetical protein